ncbi:MAG: septum site-determining protein MinC [Neisseria sp.]|nr:septum site-determining protein MinC [Neisseria sp.]
MKPAFEVKSVRLDALALQPDSTDESEWAQTLDENAARYRELNLPLVLDLQAFDPRGIDAGALAALFRSRGLPLAAIRHHDAAWAKTAAENGLAFSEAPPPGAGVREEKAGEERPPALAAATVFVSTPVRTGQQVYAENADLIVTGAVSQGAELIADGNIHIYAPMRGRALAGAQGRRDARIFIHSMQAELVSVAGIYRNFEQDLPKHLHRQAVQIHLQDDRLVISAIAG